MKREIQGFAGWLLLACMAISSSAHAQAQAEQTSDDGIYTVSYSSAIDPLPVNQMHEWVLHIETVDGDLVEDAAIVVDGGMPAHNHGLPTQPRVTEYLGEGNYRVQGLRFHMRGSWEVTFDVREAERSDTITFELML